AWPTRRMPLLPLSGPLTKQRARASSAPWASGPIEAESKAKCAVGMSPQALMILSSIWIDPLVGDLVSSFGPVSFAPAAATGLAVDAASFAPFAVAIASAP